MTPRSRLVEPTTAAPACGPYPAAPGAPASAMGPVPPAAHGWDPAREARGTDSGLAAYWRARPAVPGAGGDWVDVVDISDGRLAICVGDAAGSDPRAAAFALRVRTALCRALLAGHAPETAVSGTVDEVAGGGDLGEMFATVLVAVADPLTGAVDYVNAGHPPALHLAAAAAPRALGPTGPILSDLFAGSRIWSARSLLMAPGDRLVLYTDGVSEARDAAGRAFGIEALSAADSRSRPPAEFLEDMVARVGAHAAGSQPDDRTLALLVRSPLPR
ncbi:PP2C family protein-serine/threonine phosphatase [Frankia canadensis]|nr:PP2C family protein-serine/threonine phosphatase [Frankia canadensis]